MRHYNWFFFIFCFLLIDVLFAKCCLFWQHSITWWLNDLIWYYACSNCSWSMLWMICCPSSLCYVTNHWLRSAVSPIILLKSLIVLVYKIRSWSPKWSQLLTDIKTTFSFQACWEIDLMPVNVIPGKCQPVTHILFGFWCNHLIKWFLFLLSSGVPKPYTLSFFLPRLPKVRVSGLSQVT